MTPASCWKGEGETKWREVERGERRDEVPASLSSLPHSSVTPSLLAYLARHLAQHGQRHGPPLREARHDHPVRRDAVGGRHLFQQGVDVGGRGEHARPVLPPLQRVQGVDVVPAGHGVAAVEGDGAGGGGGQDEAGVGEGGPELVGDVLPAGLLREKNGAGGGRSKRIVRANAPSLSAAPLLPEKRCGPLSLRPPFSPPLTAVSPRPCMMNTAALGLPPALGSRMVGRG